MENINSEAMPAFDPMARFADLAEAQAYLAQHGQSEAYAPIADQGEYILYRRISADRLAQLEAENGNAPQDAPQADPAPKAKPQGKPEGKQKPAPRSKAAKAKAKAKPQGDAPKADAPPADAPKAKAGKKGSKARIAAQGDLKAKPKGKAKDAPAPIAAAGPKDMHYSRDDLKKISAEMIAAGLKGMNLKDRDDYRNALKGELPKDPPFGLAATHDPFRKGLAELDAMRAKGDLEGLEAWMGGRGTRMTCSSTIPLGRYHQKLLLALRFRNKAKLAAKAKREAKKAEAANGAPATPQADPAQASS